MAFTPAPKGDQIGAVDRVLPNDMQAEQSVLGGMLLSQDAVADVFEYIGSHDFYAPKHELILARSTRYTAAVSRPTSSPSPQS